MWNNSKLAAVIIVSILLVTIVPIKLRGADKEYGQYLSTECNTCHDSSKKSAAGIPSLHGKSFQYLVKALEQYKSKYRKNAVMQMVAGRLDSAQIEALAVYFSTLETD